MDEISGELKRAESQRETLFKAFQQVQSQASSVLSFTLQWKDLEERFDGIRGSLERRAKELDEGQRSLAERAREVESREDGLRSAWQRVEECEEEVRKKKMDLRSVETRLEECRDEHRKKESELILKRDALTECDSLLRDKEEELRYLMHATDECCRDYGSKKEEVELLRQELDLKEKKVESVQSLLEENARELGAKVDKLGSVQAKLEEVAKALELKSGELNAVQASIKVRNLELASKKRQLESIQIDIAESAEQLRLKEQELAFIQTSTLECAKALESKNKQYDLIQESITECSQELESKTRQLDSVQKRSRECVAELGLKEKKLYKLDVSIGEHSQLLEMKKKECNEQCMELELLRQRLDSTEKSIEKCSPEMDLRERSSGRSGVMAQNWKDQYGPVLASCVNPQSTIAFDGKKMQMFIYQHFHELNRVCHKVLEIIKTSANAAKLVVDAMEGFYPQNSGNGDELLDIGVIRRSCIFLLENFIRSSVEIKPQQREAAMKLAVEWKGKLKFSLSQEYSLEVWDFLKLLEAYKLASAFNANEIHDLLNYVSQFQVAQELQQVPGSSAVPPGSFGYSQHWLRETEEPENFAVSNAGDSSVVNPPLPTVSARKDMQLVHTEVLNENAMICKEISHKLQNSSDPAKLVLDVFAGSYTQYSNRAMKLAREWKAKLSNKPESGLEVLVFQNFLAAYNLVSLLNDSEILKLAEIVSQKNDTSLLGQITAHQLAYLLLSPECISSRPD
ncbi:kinesin-like protein KIF27 isoform X2 [Rhodamnia argentea]|uniref:FRIGIDA-like protein n=1 Tax=Rhodamnia argentea TaxID=178133 RepID=A0ABM3HLF3_9MYRT|nr:kinesin-like protein KIF27 isoform X2 [Rhodamnia argentea]